MKIQIIISNNRKVVDGIGHFFIRTKDHIFIEELKQTKNFMDVIELLDNNEEKFTEQLKAWETPDLVIDLSDNLIEFAENEKASLELMLNGNKCTEYCEQRYTKG